MGGDAAEPPLVPNVRFPRTCTVPVLYVWCVGHPHVWYYGITGHSMSICMLAHDNMMVPCMRVHVHGICVRASACMVQCARAYGCTNSCMCVRLYVYDCMLEGELCCMCRRGLTRIVRAMCVSAHAYTAARVYVCVRACSWKHRWCLNLCVRVHGI